MVSEVKVAQSRLTLCDPLGFTVHGILQARTLEWVASPFSRGTFPIEGLNPGLLHCGRILYPLSHQGSPRTLGWAQCYKYRTLRSVTRLRLRKPGSPLSAKHTTVSVSQPLHRAGEAHARGVRAEGARLGVGAPFTTQDCAASVTRAGETGTRLLVRECAGLPQPGPSSLFSHFSDRKMQWRSFFPPLSLPPWFSLPLSPCLPSSSLSKIEPPMPGDPVNSEMAAKQEMEINSGLKGPSCDLLWDHSGPRGATDAGSEIKRSEPWPQLERPADHRHQLLPVLEQRLLQPEPLAWELTPDPRPGG